MNEPSPRLATAHTVLGSFLLAVGLGHMGFCAWVFAGMTKHGEMEGAVPFVMFVLLLAVGSAVVMGIGGLDLAVGRQLRSGGVGGRMAASGLAVPNLIVGALGLLAVGCDVIAVLGI